MQQIITTKYNHHLELLEDLVDRPHPHAHPHAHPPYPVTLIVCSSKEDFLNQLIPPILNHQPATLQREHVNDDVDDDENGDEEDYEDNNNKSKHHQFFTSTLRLLAASQHITVRFTPSVPVFRALLSSHSLLLSPSRQNGSIIVLDMLALHHGTSEFTLQGLSRSMAAVVSAASTASSDTLKLVECKDWHDPANPNRGSNLWNAQVPLLSGSVKIGEEGSRWAATARTIAVRRLASRWFTFEDNDVGDPKDFDANNRGTAEERNEVDDDMPI